MPNLTLALMVVVALSCVVAPVVIVPVGLFLLIRRREDERSRPLELLAASLGLVFQSRHGVLPPVLGELAPFDKGFSGKVFNLMTGVIAGTELVGCDYATLRKAGGIVQRRTAFSPHQVAAFRLHGASSPDLEALRRDARASVFRTECGHGWLVVSRSGFVSPDAMPRFVADAARMLALVAPEQGEAVVLAVEPACMPNEVSGATRPS